MKKTILMTFFSMMSFIYSANAANNFINGMEDIPIPAQTIQLPAGDISFGNEETRLVEAYLKTKKQTFAAIKEFYLETLPQLGWLFEGQKNNTLTFSRNGEELDIARESGKPLIVRVTLTGTH